MISEATHKSGNVLDLLFTNVPHIIEDIAILDQNEVCLSDHKGITLKVKLQRAHKKKYNHIVYDFSKAKWRDLNFDIKHSAILDNIRSNDPYVAWDLFKSELTQICDKHIPKKKLKTQFQPPWFDQDCVNLYKKKKNGERKLDPVLSPISRDFASVVKNSKIL